MEEGRKLLVLSTGMIILLVMVFFMGQIFGLMEQAEGTVTEYIKKMENGEQIPSVVPEDSVNTDNKEDRNSVDTEIVISDSSVSKLLVVVLVVVFGGIAVAAILVWREKVRREQEYTREVLSKPLERFASVELDELKEKYD